MARGPARTALTYAISLLAVVLFIPVVIGLSAAIMLVVFWPAFLGAHLEYGFVLGERINNPTTLWPEWYLLNALWMACLVGGPLLARRFHLGALTVGLKDRQVARLLARRA